MPSSSALARQSAAQARVAADTARQGQQTEQVTEANRGSFEASLGSEEFGQSPVVEGFDRQYSFESTGSKKAAANMLSTNTDRWNADMTRAHAMAQAGDMEGANALKASVEAEFSAYQTTLGDKKGAKRAGRFGRITEGTLDRSAGARAQQTPSARIVSNLVRDARELQDPNSAASMRFKNALTEGAIAEIDAGQVSAERGIASEQRTAARGLRDASLGGALRPGQSAAFAARAGERFAAIRAEGQNATAAARAQVFSEAAKTYEGFSRDFAANTVRMTQEFISGVSTFRDTYRAMQLDLVKTISGVWAGQAGVTGGMAEAFRAAEATESSAMMGAISGVASSAMGMCWVADLLFGVGSRKAAFARMWCGLRPRNLFVRLYARHGQNWALWLEANTWAKPPAFLLWSLLAWLGQREWARRLNKKRAK